MEVDPECFAELIILFHVFRYFLPHHIIRIAFGVVNACSKFSSLLEVHGTFEINVRISPTLRFYAFHFAITAVFHADPLLGKAF
jgi:hypothetical protein